MTYLICRVIQKWKTLYWGVDLNEGSPWKQRWAWLTSFCVLDAFSKENMEIYQGIAFNLIVNVGAELKILIQNTL